MTIERKSADDYFADWESHYFGYGYGTGEPHVLQALHNFFCSIPADGHYNYEVLERGCGQQVAWLLINMLAHARVMDYGTSARYGWLTGNGKALAEYIRSRSVDQLIEATDRDENYAECFPDYCNCVGQERAGCCGLNPFWPEQEAAN
jgi:hypothetical protein